MPLNTLGERISYARHLRGLTLDNIAQAVGVHKSTIQRYEKDEYENPKLPVIESIARVLSVNPVWLIGKSDDMTAFETTLPDNIIPMPAMGGVPLLGEIACGEPITAEENVAEYVDLPEHIKADFALRCKGDSMINARIHDGDIVYIRQQDSVDNGQIAAVLIGDEATLKRVNYNPSSKTLILSPANDAYAPFVFVGDELDRVRILGRAVAFTSAIR